MIDMAIDHLYENDLIMCCLEDDGWSDEDLLQYFEEEGLSLEGH
ncbi:hypothetical protein ACFWY5_29655 [Nonomuraea sp. NPDC059007]